MFGILSMFFDYVRIRIVVTQSYDTLMDIWLTFKMIIKNFFKLSFLYWFVAFIGLIIFLLYFTIDNVFNPNTFLLIVLLLIIRQAYIGAKIWVKLLFYSSQLEMYKEITASIVRLEASEINLPKTESE
jgi:hypothetical protein